MDKRFIIAGGATALVAGLLTLWSLTAVFTTYTMRYGAQVPHYSTVPGEVQAILGLITLMGVVVLFVGLRSAPSASTWRQGKLCLYCAREVTENDVFCPHCGKKIKEEQKVVECPRCNMPTLSSNEYCPKCGEKMPKYPG